MKRLLVLTLAPVLLVATPALAGIGGQNGEIGFDFGYTDVDADLSGNGGARLAFRGGYHFTRLFQIEGQSVGMAADDTTTGGTDVTTIIGAFFVNGVFNFHSPKNHVVPYVLAGVGIATVRLDFDFFGEVEDTGGAWQIAGGSRFFFGRSKRAALRLEASFMKHRTTDLFISPGDGEAFSEASLTAGFTWRIGDEK